MSDPGILRPVCDRVVPCKCCRLPSPLFGVADFHRHCNTRDPPGLPLSGIPIYYHRCTRCGFLFTTVFDALAPGELARLVYNADYIRVDPDFLEERPRANAELLGRVLGGARDSAILDYGGGQGRLAEHLESRGFAAVDTYDPFVPRFANRPDRRYDCIVSFEVAEHAVAPLAVFEAMCELLADPGLVLFSTLVQPPGIEQIGMGWWYIGPRNGHVSLHSRQSLGMIAKRLQLNFGSFNNNLHAMWRHLPPFARGLIRSG